MNNLIKIAAFFLSLIFTTSLNATLFYLDEFSVSRDNFTFTDTFSDGAPPPSGPFGANTYRIEGNLGPESGGRLEIDTFDGVFRATSVSGNERFIQRSRLRTSTSNNLAIPGLKIDNDISVLGRFDLIAPEFNRERYSVRLTDFRSGYAANDNVEVGVFRNAVGNLSIQFREADFDANVFNILGNFSLSESYFDSYEQISLNLFTNANDNNVYAGFELLDLDGLLDPFGYQFGASGNIFDGESWTRAGFYTVVAAASAAVPEPSSLALLGLGLAGLGIMGRRKNRKKQLR